MEINSRFDGNEKSKTAYLTITVSLDDYHFRSVDYIKKSFDKSLQFFNPYTGPKSQWVEITDGAERAADNASWIHTGQQDNLIGFQMIFKFRYVIDIASVEIFEILKKDSVAVENQVKTLIEFAKNKK